MYRTLTAHKMLVCSAPKMMSLSLFKAILVCLDRLYSYKLSLMFLSAENKIKAGQLKVMKALVDVMLVHKTDAAVAQQAAGALLNICVNGV